MILLLVLVMAWLVILGPGLLRRWAGHGDGISSVSHFHRQLRVLEHSGTPPIVRPAYRLQGEQPAARAKPYPDVASVPVLTVVGADKLPRPALAFLADDRTGEGDRTGPGDRIGEGDRTGGRGAAPSEQPTREGRALDHPHGVPLRPMTAEARRSARRRRRSTLTVLVALFLLTFVIGFIPGAGPAWIVTVVAALASGAYVALLVHLRAVAEENERTLRYLSTAARHDRRSGATAFVGDDDGWWDQEAVPADQDLAVHAGAR
jgi:hypothetical protein